MSQTPFEERPRQSALTRDTFVFLTGGIPATAGTLQPLSLLSYLHPAALGESVDQSEYFVLMGMASTPSVGFGLGRDFANLVADLVVRRSAPAPSPPAFRAFKQLGEWLQVSDDHTADLLGVGRTTPYAWKRDGREPRAATAQRLYEYHATLNAIQRRIGVEALHAWLQEGQPARRSILLSGNLAALDHDVHRLLFTRPPERRLDLAWAPEDTADTGLEPTGERPRASGRRPRRVLPR